MDTNYLFMINSLRLSYLENRDEVFNTLSSIINDDDSREVKYDTISRVIKEMLLQPTGLLPDLDEDTIEAFLEICYELLTKYINKQNAPLTLADVLGDSFFEQ